MQKSTSGVTAGKAPLTGFLVKLKIIKSQPFKVYKNGPKAKPSMKKHILKQF